MDGGLPYYTRGSDQDHPQEKNAKSKNGCREGEDVGIEYSWVTGCNVRTQIQRLTSWLCSGPIPSLMWF